MDLSTLANSGSLLPVGVGLSVLTGLGAGIGIGIAAAGAAQGTARQPEAASKIRNVMLLGAVLAESTAIYGLFMSILLYLKMK
jgi:F-type H+-transporting ATPase subunit c